MASGRREGAVQGHGRREVLRRLSLGVAALAVLASPWRLLFSGGKESSPPDLPQGVDSIFRPRKTPRR
ncbi:MAG: hypothetical protein ACE5IG_02810 [Dehalococcoidia bacterium]